MKWLIVIPAWGERALDYLVGSSLPSVQAALRYDDADLDARFIVHTDDERRVRKLLGGQVLTQPAPQCVSKYHGLGYCHQQAISRAEPGEAVAIVNADFSVSVELFAACEARFAAGKKLIMAAATRTISKDKPPIGIKSRDLLSWIWDHRHPVMNDAIWGTGRSRTLSCLHFVDGEEVVTRAFHLHPIAFVRQAGQRFGGITIDDGLIDCFARDEVHVVTSPDELALAECSPSDYGGSGSRDCVITSEHVALWANKVKGPGRVRVTAAHKWLFTHRISIHGTDREIGDTAVAQEILGLLNK